MKKTTIKALYLFLCSILGMVLFGMLHRSVFVLYDLLLTVDYETYSFGMPYGAIPALDFTTMLLMLFLGGWYGIVLGLEWYALVYGPNAATPAGLFHGFVPHSWRGRKKAKTNHSRMESLNSFIAPQPAASSTTVKVPVAESQAWSFDDLITPQPAKKKTARKSTTRKTTPTRRASTTKRVKAASI